LTQKHLPHKLKFRNFLSARGRGRKKKARGPYVHELIIKTRFIKGKGKAQALCDKICHAFFFKKCRLWGLSGRLPAANGLQGVQQP
jgi:hypothetical protein